MITTCFNDDFFFQESKLKPRQPNMDAGILENQDGSHMLIAESETFEFEEEAMNLEPNSPLTFKGALKIAGGALLIIGSVMWAAYTQIQGQITDLRGEISTLRTSNHDDFNRVADKLDDIGKTLTAIQVDQATQKAKSEKSN